MYVLVIGYKLLKLGWRSSGTTGAGLDSRTTTRLLS
jgi:hypothetical protein